MDVESWVQTMESLLSHRERIRWRLGDKMVEAQALGDEAYQALFAGESLIHVLRQYQECASAYPEEERNYSLPWVHHHILRHHPKRAEWLQMCQDNGVLCDRVLRDLLNR